MSSYVLRRAKFQADLETILSSSENDRLLLINPATLEMELSEHDREGWDSHELYDLFNTAAFDVLDGADNSKLIELADEYVFEHN